MRNGNPGLVMGLRHETRGPVVRNTYLTGRCAPADHGQVQAAKNEIFGDLGLWMC
jgi:hypothetical protein